MQTISDNKKQLDLNPKQFYIILREDNKQYHKLYKEIAEASENDEIRFCIMDTTETKENLLERTVLYQRFMGEDVEGGPWDFIIRNYPDDGNFSFSCWHKVSDDENDIKENLNSWKKDKERDMWEKITKTFCGYFAKNTSTKSKIRAFYETIDEILQSKGVPSTRLENERDNLGRNLESYNGYESIKLVKDFVGENMSKIDAFFNVKSREKSDEYMRCFFETGGYIARPKLKIVNTGNVYNGGVHDKYRLKVTTTSGRTEEVTFSSTNSFAMYIFYMTNPKIKIKKIYFIPGHKKAQENWEKLFAIYATLGDSLQYIESQHRLEEFYNDFFVESKKIWSNSHKDKEAFKKFEAEAEIFRIHPIDDNMPKPERWLDLSKNYIDYENENFNKDYNDNLKIIKSKELYKTFERERKRKLNNENTLQSVH